MKALHAATLLAVPAVAAGPARAQELWKEFAHPDDPHVDLHDPDIPITTPELFADEGAVKYLRVLVVLLEFDDLAPQAQHTPAFYADMVFGTGAGPWSSVRPSVAQTVAAGSNGRLQLLPAFEGHGTLDDGVVGWVTAQCPPGVVGSCGYDWYGSDCGDDLCIQKKRAEAVRRADDFVYYPTYDVTGPAGVPDGLVTSDELTVVVINADDACCDQHGEVGHASPGGCSGCAGGNARTTDPKLVPVDGVQVRQLVAGLVEGAAPNVLAHELGHQTFGHGDLYAANGNPWADVGGARQVYAFGGGLANDDCADGVPMSDGDEWRGSTAGAAIGMDPSSCGFEDTVDVWFTYTPATTGPVTFTTCFSDTDFDTVLTVYDGCGLGGELACNDDDPACTNYRSTVSTVLSAGVTYRLRLSGYGGATGKYRLGVQGGGGQAGHPPETFFPQPPGRHSLMSIGAGSESQYLYHLDPWAKLHLGMLKPRVVTHDGVYSIWAAEPQATFAAQTAEPQALVVYDPLRAPLHADYFLLENRTFQPWTGGPLTTDDTGLALWLIDEEPYPGKALNLRQAVRLRRRAGMGTSDDMALWDGSDPAQVYDVTPTSTPTSSAWNDGSTSHVELRDVSAAGPVMSVFVRMPPLFVDAAHVFGPWVGTEVEPFASVSAAAAAVAAQDLDGDGVQDGRRTLRVAPGSYAENPTITAPVLIETSGGTAVVGTP